MENIEPEEKTPIEEATPEDREALEVHLNKVQLEFPDSAKAADEDFGGGMGSSER